MIRGNRAIVSIISDDLTAEKHVKGESMNDRDTAIACRFFYHGYLIGKRYDVCLAALSKEFFLSENVIIQLLMKQQDFLKKLRSNNTTAKDLQKLYFFYDWRT